MQDSEKGSVNYFKASDEVGYVAAYLSIKMSLMLDQEVKAAGLKYYGFLMAMCHMDYIGDNNGYLDYEKYLYFCVDKGLSDDIDYIENEVIRSLSEYKYVKKVKVSGIKLLAINPYVRITESEKGAFVVMVRLNESD